MAALPNTLLLTVLALMVQYTAGVPIGVYAALHHRRAFDQVSNIYASVIHAVPGFWLGILLALTLSDYLTRPWASY